MCSLHLSLPTAGIHSASPSFCVYTSTAHMPHIHALLALLTLLFSTAHSDEQWGVENRISSSALTLVLMSDSCFMHNLCMDSLRVTFPEPVCDNCQVGEQAH